MPTSIDLRIFTWLTDGTKGHSYLVGNDQGGLTPVLERVYVNDLTTTFENLRDLIETKKENMMTRRTALFQEVIHAAASAENHHDWSERVSKSSYRLGYYSDGDFEGCDAPKLIPLQDEGELVAAPFLRNNGVENRSDVPCVIIVPLSQVGPSCNQCCKSCEMCAKDRYSDKLVQFYIDGHIHSVKMRDMSTVNVDCKLEQAEDIARALRRMGSSINEAY